MTDKDEYKKILSLLKEIRTTKISHEELIFLRKLIEEKQIQTQLWASVQGRILGNTGWAALVGIAMACAYFAKQWLTGN